MPADLQFLIVLCALALVNVAVWRAANPRTEFSLRSDKATARYALLALIASGIVVAIVAASLNWGAL